MTFTLHVRVTELSGERVYTHVELSASYLSKLVEVYVLDPSHVSLVFTVSRERKP